MALSTVTKQIRDGLNVAFAAVWAKVSSAPAAALNTDTVLPCVVMIDGNGNLVDAALATVTHATVSTSTSSGVALAANASARYRCLQNKSASINITLNLGGTAVAGTGIVLFPLDSYEMSPKGGNLFTGAINAIADSGTPALSVTEGV